MIGATSHGNDEPAPASLQLRGPASFSGIATLLASPPPLLHDTTSSTNPTRILRSSISLDLLSSQAPASNGDDEFTNLPGHWSSLQAYAGSRRARRGAAKPAARRTRDRATPLDRRHAEPAQRAPPRARRR